MLSAENIEVWLGRHQVLRGIDVTVPEGGWSSSSVRTDPARRR
jgi:ABC-type branched-subunit amino acid transport system ATPase component